MSNLDDMIARCDALLDAFIRDDAMRLVGDYALCYMKQVEELTGISIKPCDPKLLDERTIRSIKSLLVALRESREHELELAKASGDSIVAEATAYASADISLSQTISSIWQIPDSVISSDDKAELTSLINDMDKSRAKGKDMVIRAGRAVADWLFDKGIEAIPTVMPLVVQTIQQCC